MAIQQMFLGMGGSSPVGPGGSVFFDANENLSTTTGSMQVFNFDSNQSFCIEAFIKMDTMSRYNYIALRWSGAGGGYLWRFGVDNNNKLFFAGAISATQSSATMTTDTWYHVAAVREGTNQGYLNYMRLYINGTEVASNSGQGAAMGSNAEPLSIGANREALQYSMRGYISNLRITNNQPVYTSSFTTPTENLTMTSQGVTASNVRLLCCQDTTDVTAAEHVQLGSLTISNGTPTASTSNPFVMSSYAVNFDGNSDYLSLAASNDLNLNAAFTIEAWVNVDDGGWSGTRRTLIANNIGWTTNHFAISLMNSGGSEENAITLWDYNNNSSGPVASSSPVKVQPSDGWTHVAITRDSSNNIRIFKNGTQAGSTITSSATYQFGIGETWIGQITMSNLAGAEQLDGKISNLRIVKGSAVYTSNFTPPTSALSNISGTVLLCCNQTTVTGATVAPGSITANDNPAITQGPF